MAFEVIPAIDVADGALARMTPRGSVPIDAFGGDPRTAAESFVLAGARWIHLVDLDLAHSGDPQNLERVIAADPGHAHADREIGRAPHHIDNGKGGDDFQAPGAILWHMGRCVP